MKKQKYRAHRCWICSKHDYLSSVVMAISEMTPQPQMLSTPNYGNAFIPCTFRKCCWPAVCCHLVAHLNRRLSHQSRILFLLALEPADLFGETDDGHIFDSVLFLHLFYFFLELFNFFFVSLVPLEQHQCLLPEVMKFVLDNVESVVYSDFLDDFVILLNDIIYFRRNPLDSYFKHFQKLHLMYLQLVLQHHFELVNYLAYCLVTRHDILF